MNGINRSKSELLYIHGQDDDVYSLPVSDDVRSFGLLSDINSSFPIPH